MGTKTISIAGATTALCLCLAGCASTSVTGGVSARDGLGADTRVFLDDACLPDEGAQSLGPFGFGATTLGEIAVGTGEIIFQSFGRYLEELGQPDIDTSTGLTSSTFYKGNPADPGYGDLNRNIRCIHVVRGGFEPGPRADAAHPAYGHLGLTSEPALYARIKLEPAPDRSAFFRGELDYAVVNRFERPGGELTRDIVISLEFGAPAAARVFTPDEFGNLVPNTGGAFAISALQLSGIERGRILSDAATNGLVTSWMNTPPLGEQEGRFAFNLYVDLVESKRGNPFLQDIGRLLQSEPVVASVGQDVQELVYDDSQRRRDRLGAEFDQRSAERSLRRSLEDEIRILESLVESGVTDEDTLISASRRVEDAVESIVRQRRVDGWVTASPDPLIRRGEVAVVEADTVMAEAPDPLP